MVGSKAGPIGAVVSGVAGALAGKAPTKLAVLQQKVGQPTASAVPAR